MADLIITAANVLPINLQEGQYDATKLCGDATLTAGQAVALTNNLWNAVDATAERSDTGIVLNNAAINQLVSVMTIGVLDLGVALQQGQIYVISATAGVGAIAPISDIIATQFINVLGYANDVNQLVIRPYNIPFALA